MDAPIGIPDYAKELLQEFDHGSTRAVQFDFPLAATPKPPLSPIAEVAPSSGPSPRKLPRRKMSASSFLGRSSGAERERRGSSEGESDVSQGNAPLLKRVKKRFSFMGGSSS
jgi:hypothetical protein